MGSQQSPLVDARYQDGVDVGHATPLTPAIELILKHQSVRSFLPDALPAGTLELLVAAGQSASTSSMLQNWSVVAVQDPEHKDNLSRLCGDQAFIRQAPLFLVFCVNLHRLEALCEQHGQTGESLDSIDLFMQGSLDAALAAQNISIAAESLGLGLCYVGAVRNNARELLRDLRLPHRAVPVFGLSIGKADPASNPPAVKPRLPLGEVLHREYWSDEAQGEHIAAYDKTLGAYYPGHKKYGRKTWSSHTTVHVSRKKLDGREVYRETLEEQGLPLK